MSNLRELIIHDCTISDFSFISNASELRKLYLVNCIFNNEELSNLSSMSNLAEISLNCMEIQSISSLASLKSLKQLSLRKIDKLKIDELSSFKFLKALCLEDLSIENFDFLNTLKSLKELIINKIKVDNLSFLKNLKNLTKFVMHENVEDESDISLITELKKIKEFQYPVSNMEIYKCCPSIISIGVDAKNIHNIEMLKNTKIDNVTVYNASSEEEVDKIISRIDEYITLSSYGSVGV
jgi:internalin A